MSATPGDRNPYEAPKAETFGESFVDFSALRPWLGVFVLNLPLPLYLGFEVTSGAAIVGMMAAVGLILVTGSWCCWRFPRLTRTVTTGGILIALSQIVPVLQFIAGLIGFGVADELGLLADDSGFGGVGTSGFVGGFAVTLVTAAVLLAAAAISGAFLQTAWQHFYVNRRTKAADAL